MSKWAPSTSFYKAITRNEFLNLKINYLIRRLTLDSPSTFDSSSTPFKFVNDLGLMMVDREQALEDALKEKVGQDDWVKAIVEANAIRDVAKYIKPAKPATRNFKGGKIEQRPWRPGGFAVAKKKVVVSKPKAMVRGPEMNQRSPWSFR